MHTLITEHAFVSSRSPSLFIDIYCNCNFFFKTTDPGKCNPLVIHRPLIRDVSRDNLTHGSHCDSFIFQLPLLSAVFHLHVFLPQPGRIPRVCRAHLQVLPAALHLWRQLGARAEAPPAGTGHRAGITVFPWAKGTVRGAKPRGGRGLGHRHLGSPRRGTAASKPASLPAAGDAFLFSASAALIYGCAVPRR